MTGKDHKSIREWQRNYRWEMKLAGYMFVAEGREETPEAMVESYFKALAALERRLGLKPGELWDILKNRIKRMRSAI